MTPFGGLGTAAGVPKAAIATWLTGAGGKSMGSDTETKGRDFGGLTVAAATMALQLQPEVQEECPVMGAVSSAAGAMQCAP